jgi:hypothetical protein
MMEMKESDCGLMKILSWNFLGWTKKIVKTLVRTAGTPSEIRIKHFPNTSIE